MPSNYLELVPIDVKRGISCQGKHEVIKKAYRHL